MDITNESLIWYPGIYHGRTYGEWSLSVADAQGNRIVELVQQRAQEDGEWAIEHNHVGDNEDKMRRMMAFVSDEKNIAQCLEHINKEGMTKERTVDWVCRELANASKWMIK